ncbi:MAG: zf-HC2 domain-containing protein [Limisphaerales bacterium]
MNWPPDILKTVLHGIRTLSPTCKQAARLQSAGLDRALTPAERFGLRSHLLLCKWCRAYGKQIKFLSAVAKEHASDDDQPSPQPALSSEARERIKRSLQSGKE